MVNGKRYLIIKKQENCCYPIKLAYWFDERVTPHHTYVDGFYHSEHYYFPHKNVIKYISMDNLPKFTEWELEDPIEGEKYLVYRVGTTRWHSPHYTIRKYHNGSFGSKDVKYWIKLLDLIEHEFYLDNWRTDMILLLGKHDVIEEYVKETLKIDVDKDIAYYPSITTHYTELDKYVEIARTENPIVITTQNSEMIDVLLSSDLVLQVITVVKHNQKVYARIKTKEEALKLRDGYGLELR